MSISTHLQQVMQYKQQLMQQAKERLRMGDDPDVINEECNNLMYAFENAHEPFYTAEDWTYLLTHATSAPMKAYYEEQLQRMRSSNAE